MVTLPTFQKLWGQVNGTLAAGQQYTLAVMSKWEGRPIGATKSIIITELGNYGGKDPFLSYILLGGAGLTLLMITVFTCFYFRKLHKVNIYSKEFVLKRNYS